MDIFYQNLQNKYDYSDSFMVVLKKIIEALIEYYGQDSKDKILSKIFDVNIHIKKEGEDSNSYISDYLGVYENHLPYDTILGYATTRPFYKDGILSSKSIIYLKSDVNLDDVMTYNILVHELCHFVKQVPFYVKGDKICGGTGLQREVYNFDGNLIERYYTSFEEASNSFDEVNVMNLLTDFEYDLYDLDSNYAFSAEFFSDLLDFMKEYDKNFHYNVINKGTDYLKSIFSSYGVQILNYFFDECVEMNDRENRGEKVNKDRLYEEFFVLTESYKRKMDTEKYGF